MKSFILHVHSFASFCLPFTYNKSGIIVNPSICRTSFQRNIAKSSKKKKKGKTEPLISSLPQLDLDLCCSILAGIWMFEFSGCRYHLQDTHGRVCLVPVYINQQAAMLSSHWPHNFSCLWFTAKKWYKIPPSTALYSYARANERSRWPLMVENGGHYREGFITIT